MNLATFDLNLLKTLLVLLQERNSNKAAERLGTSQPAVSRTLSKLRKELNDPLFIRHSRGLILTPRAEQIALELPGLMNSLEQALLKTGFDPSRQKGRLNLALNGFVIESHGYQIYQAFLEAAPDLQLELHSYSSVTASQLVSGEIDAGINLYPLDVSKELRQIPVGEFRFGLICRVGHPLANQTIELARVFDHELAGLILPDHNLRNFVAGKYADAGVEVKLRFRCQQVNPVLRAVETSDLLFVAPTMLVDSLDSARFACINVHSSNDVLNHKLGLIYNHRHSNSPKYLWLEEMIG